MNEQQNNKMMEEVKMKPGASERMQRKPFIRDRKQGRLSATHVQIPVLRGRESGLHSDCTGMLSSFSETVKQYEDSVELRVLGRHIPLLSNPTDVNDVRGRPYRRWSHHSDLFLTAATISLCMLFRQKLRYF